MFFCWVEVDLCDDFPGLLLWDKIFRCQQVDLEDGTSLATDVAMDLTELLALEPDALEGGEVTFLG